MQSNHSQPQPGGRRIPFNPRLMALLVFAGIFGVVLLIGWAIGDLPLGITLGAWGGLLAVYILYRTGFFAERVTLLLPGASVAQTAKMRRMSGRQRAAPATAPRFLGADEADRTEGEVEPEDRVIGLEIGGHAIAYPLAAMGAREVAHEVLDGRHVFVTWWPVTYSARAFVMDAPAGGGEPSLAPVRKMVLNSSVLLAPGGRHVAQFIGQVVRGPGTGESLRQVPVVSTNWRAWCAAFPHTEVMSLEGTQGVDVFERYYMSPRAGLHQQPAKDRRWHDKDTVLGVAVDGDAKAYPYPALIEQPLVEDEVGGEPLMVAHERISATAVAFSRRVDGRTLSFRGATRNPRRPTAAAGETDIRRRINYEPWLLSDRETGSMWSAVSGVCVSGEMDGSRLETLPGQTAFWFAWSRFYPDTRVMEPQQPSKGESS